MRYQFFLCNLRSLRYQLLFDCDDGMFLTAKFAIFFYFILASFMIRYVWFANESSDYSLSMIVKSNNKIRLHSEFERVK